MDREIILKMAIAATCGDRDASYGDPSINLELAGKLKALIRQYGADKLGDAELEALDMVLTKIGRVVTGKDPKPDTYVDGAAYFAIAGQMRYGCDLSGDTRVSYKLIETFDDYIQYGGVVHARDCKIGKVDPTTIIPGAVVPCDCGAIARLEPLRTSAKSLDVRSMRSRPGE